MRKNKNPFFPKYNFLVAAITFVLVFFSDTIDQRLSGIFHVEIVTVIEGEILLIVLLTIATIIYALQRKKKVFH